MTASDSGSGQPSFREQHRQTPRDQRRAEEAMRDGEMSTSKLVSLMPAAVYTCDSEGRLTFYNQRAAELWGRQPKLGEDQEKFCGSFRMWTPDGSLLRHDECPMAEAIREGRAARNLEVIIEQPAGSRVVANVNIDPLYDAESRLVGAINVFMDITEKKRSAEALRDSEQALRRTEAWLAAQKDAFHAAMNDAPLEKSLGVLIRAITEQADGKPRCAFYIGNGAGGLHHVVGMSNAYAEQVDGFEISPESLACGLAVATGEPVITPDVLEEPRWERWTWLARQYGYRGCWSFPVETASGRLVGSFAMYFSEPRKPTRRDLDLVEGLTQTAAILISRYQESEKRAQAEAALRANESILRLLLAELQHRVRNILATVRSIANRTGGAYGSLAEFQVHFDGRLSALGRTQNVLTRSPGASVDLESLVREELLAQAAMEKNFSLAGPGIRLSPKAAEVVTLAIHELATNSTKYGAFTRSGGHIEIEWSKIEREGESWLSLDWAESGVRMRRAKPTRKGFGTELITRRIPHELHGEGSIKFASGGIHAQISFPLRDGQSTLETGFRLQVEGQTS